MPSMAPLLLLMLLLTCTLTAAQVAEEATSFGGDPSPPSACKDYAGRTGTCDIIFKCPALLTIVQSNPTAAQLVPLRQSICGQRGRQLLICCATGAPPTQPPTPSPTPPPTAQPPTSGTFTGEPEQHPRRQLLPDPSSFQCGTSDFTIKIVGGEVADLGEYPWLARLGYEWSGAAEVEFNCGGVLINDRYVLTAAHCVTGLPAEFRLAKVRLGEYDFSSVQDCFLGFCIGPVQDFEPEEIIPHADYNSPQRFKNDIALIRLNRPFNRSILSDISPICLPFDDFRKEPLDDKEFWVAGFGLTETAGKKSEVMMHDKVTLFDSTRCAEIFLRKRVQIGPTQLCAGGTRGQDLCPGDFGGPLMATSRFGPPHYAVGVVSFGVTRCGTEKVPGVYTRVSEYLNWIMDNMRE